VPLKAAASCAPAVGLAMSRTSAQGWGASAADAADTWAAYLLEPEKKERLEIRGAVLRESA
jgi:hypothetical protein